MEKMQECCRAVCFSKCDQVHECKMLKQTFIILFLMLISLFVFF